MDQHVRVLAKASYLQQMVCKSSEVIKYEWKLPGSLNKITILLSKMVQGETSHQTHYRHLEE